MLTNPSPSKIETLDLDDEKRVIPLYDSKDLPENYCARYVRFGASFIFNNSLPTSHAWEMRSKKGVFTLVADNLSFPHLAEVRIIKPGAVVGIHYYDSENNREERQYTHVALYLGQKRCKSIFLEQFGDEIRIMSLKDYELSKMNIQEALSSKAF